MKDVNGQEVKAYDVVQPLDSTVLHEVLVIRKSAADIESVSGGDPKTVHNFSGFAKREHCDFCYWWSDGQEGWG